MFQPIGLMDITVIIGLAFAGLMFFITRSDRG